MKMIENHLESIFDIEPGTTIAPVQQPMKTEIVQTNDADTSNLINQEDKEIGEQLATIYGYAVEAFEQQTNLITEVDPRFAARNAEVAAQYLNIALNSVNSRATIRNNKLKLKVDSQTPGTVNQNLIVADRNELLRLLGDQ
jgi:hypothetical protein